MRYLSPTPKNNAGFTILDYRPVWKHGWAIAYVPAADIVLYCGGTHSFNHSTRKVASSTNSTERLAMREEPDARVLPIHAQDDINPTLQASLPERPIDQWPVTITGGDGNLRHWLSHAMRVLVQAALQLWSHLHVHSCPGMREKEEIP